MTDRDWYERSDVWIVAGETTPGFWVVSFYPRDREDAAWPGFTLTSDEYEIPTTEGAEAVVEWADDYWRQVKEKRR